MSATNPYIIGNFSNRNITLPQQHLCFLHSQHIQIITDCPACMRLKNTMQISGMQIDCSSDILNLNTLVIILMKEFDTPPNIEL
ncbi:hypothetical protein D3C78_1191130 [compost metagenome]